MSRLHVLAAALTAAFAFSAHAEGDPAAGKERNFQCKGCHGIPGWKTAFPEVYPVPKLGGQHPAYIVSALKAYKKGDRDHATMRAIAGDLSDKDMDDLAAYYGAAPAETTAAKK